MRLWRVVFGSIGAVLLATAGAAQDDAVEAVSATAEAEPEDASLLFASDGTLRIVIEAPLTQLIRGAEDDPEPFEGSLTLSDDVAAGGFPISLSARGLSRRKGGFCRFPPLRVDFDRSERPLDGTVFEGQNKLKLVTHCQSSSRYEQYYVREYLAYRILNEVSPISFRVRPLEVTYRDTDGKRRDETRFGFFIEDVDDAAKRNGLREFDDVDEIRYAQLDAEQATVAALFQYMIGNLDWDFTAGPVGDQCCHNARLAGVKGEESNLRPMPYDFDFSGFVDAPYAAPPESIRVRDVTVRRFRGLCEHTGELPAAAERFRDRRDAIFEAIDSDPHLDKGSRSKARRYIESFFEILDNERRFEREIVKACR